ncbi:MAG: hypothetical protein Q7Q71_05005 [Verrucomicrobiota bacterium JB023]|nr:hypothetical protein [Verrucomicrobiota bacterium JB023]
MGAAAGHTLIGVGLLVDTLALFEFIPAQHFGSALLGANLAIVIGIVMVKLFKKPDDA